MPLARIADIAGYNMKALFKSKEILDDDIRLNFLSPNDIMELIEMLNVFSGFCCKYCEFLRTKLNICLTASKQS